MFKENILVTSLSLAISILSFQSDVFASDSGDGFRVVNWEISDYRTVGESKKTVSSDNVVSSVDKVSYKVKSGDNIQVILSKNGVKKDDLTNLVYNSPKADKLSKLRIGQELDLYKIGDRLDKLVIHINEFKSIVAINKKGKYLISDVDTPFVVEQKHISTKIDGDLSKTLVRNGVSASQSNAIRKAFFGTVDFKKLRKGDTFNLVIEEKIVNSGKILGYGDVVAVEIITSGVKHSAYLHKTNKGKSYYDASGKSLEAAFLRHPLAKVRITSKFNMHRMHPILKRVAPHRGNDYGAPRGTPIIATADGVVKNVEVQRGYGKVVIIEHSGGYKTLYAHMHKYNTKRGARVKKGDVIGFVGSTGYATGPHLHYELIANGKHVDSVKAKIPEGIPLSGEQLAKFKGNVYDIAMKLERVKGSSGGDYIIASNAMKKYYD